MPPIRSSLGLRTLSGRLFALLLLFGAGCAGSRHADLWSPPRLSVVVVVDQMRQDDLVRFADLYTGGLLRLYREGIVFANAHQDHAVTETAPGHAALATGVYPNRNGLVSNSWWDPVLGRSVYAVEDTVAIPGEPDALGSSPVLLQRETLGSWLKRSRPEGRVFSVSLKDRAAIPLAGHDADAAYWYLSGRFVSSLYYVDAHPEWVERFNASGRADSYFAQGWQRLLPESAYSLSREDDFPVEADGVHTTFPHAFRGNEPGPEYYDHLSRTPFGDELTLAFARELIVEERLGAGGTVDLLFVSASALDGIGHAFGPYSQEVQDYYLRLDRMLGDFFAFLDHEVGRGAYALALASDHGVMPMPEELQRRGIPARRFDPRAVLEPVVERTAAALNIHDVRFALADGMRLSFTPTSSIIPMHVALRRELAAALRELDLVEDVFTVDELVSSRTPDRPFLAEYRRSLRPENPPDLMLRFREYHLPHAQPTGTSHGSPYAYDTHVPLIFWHPHLPAARYERRVRAVDMAPTLATMLRILVPDDLDGIVLPEVLRAMRSSIAGL